MVKDWSTDRWKSMWNKEKNFLRIKEFVGWTSSRLTIRLLNLTGRNLIEYSASFNWELQSTATQEN